MIIHMGARGNELSSRKILGKLIEKQKCYKTIRTLSTMSLKKILESTLLLCKRTKSINY